MCSACTIARTGWRFLVLLCDSPVCMSRCISGHHYLNSCFVYLARHELHFEDCVVKAHLKDHCSALHDVLIQLCYNQPFLTRKARSCIHASRHRDGVWRSADEVPQGPGGRPLAFIAVNGHGAYPVAGTIPRIFYAVRLFLVLFIRLPACVSSWMSCSTGSPVVDDEGVSEPTMCNQKFDLTAHVWRYWFGAGVKSLKSVQLYLTTKKQAAKIIHA